MPTNKNKLADLLHQKDPRAMRESINKVNIVQEATGLTNDKNRTEIPNGINDENNDRNKSVVNIDEETTEKKSSVNQNDITSEINDGGLPVGNPQHISRTKNTNRKPDVKKRARKSPHYSEQDIRTLLANNKRQTTRYSFEVYIDQKTSIEDACELYEEITGDKLSASRLLREMIDAFLPDVFHAFEQSVRENRTEK